MKFTKHAMVALLIIYAQLLKAQTIEKDTVKTVTLGEVVISANKVEETKRTIAQQVQVLNSKQITASQSQTTADLIAGTGNVYIQKSQLGGGSVTIRGFEANRTLLVIDGVRMNNLIYRSGHLQNIVTLDNNTLERVEVLFGPSSTVYGSDALGGVIHLYTKKPIFANDGEKQKIKVNAFSRYGGVNDEFTGHVDFNVGGKKIASITSVTYSNFGDLRGGTNQNPFYTQSYGERPFYVERINDKDSLVKNDDRYLQTQSGYKQYDLLQKISYKQNEQVSHGLNLQYSNSTNVPRYDRLTDPSGSGLRYSEWYYGPQMRMMGAYDLNVHNAAATFQNIHAGVSFQNIEESRHTRTFGNNNLSSRIEKVNVIGADLDFQKVLKHHNIRFGLDAQYNTLKSTAKETNILTGTRVPLDTRYPDGDNTMTNAAVYVSHTWQLNPQLAITDGLRLGFVSLHSTFVDTSFFRFPFTEVNQSNAVYSGSLGFIHTPTDDLKLSLLLSTGFRAPNMDDLSKVFESSSGAVIVPNENLKPEKTVNYELGITKLFNQKTSWENAVYYTDFINAIVTDEFTYNGKDSILYDGSQSRVYANQNKGRAYLLGFSSTIKSQCTDNLLLTLSGNYTYGRVKTDSSDYPLDHIPPFMMRMQLTYSNDNFGADFLVNYNGWKKIKDYYLNGEDNEQYATPAGMPAWITATIRLSYKVHKLITVQAGVDNIFDTQYRTFASGMNAPGRNVFAALRFHY